MSERMNDRQKAEMLKAFCDYAASTGAVFPNGRPDKPAVSHPEPGAMRREEQAPASPSHPSREQKGFEQ